MHKSPTFSRLRLLPIELRHFFANPALTQVRCSSVGVQDLGAAVVPIVRSVPSMSYALFFVSSLSRQDLDRVRRVPYPYFRTAVSRHLRLLPATSPAACPVPRYLERERHPRVGRLAVTRLLDVGTEVENEP